MSQPTDNTLYIQTTFAAPPAQVFQALVDNDALEQWFAEAADVALPRKQYDFWGRFTPHVPNRDEGVHPLLQAEDNRLLRYQWPVQDVNSAVSLTLSPHPTGARLNLQHGPDANDADFSPFGYEDFWFLSLENLRRFLDGRGIVRCDFAAIEPGDFEKTVTIEAAAAEVFDALIRPEQLERWIASNATVELYENGKYDLGWGDGGAIKILELVPNEKITYSWSGWHIYPETATTWQLEAAGGKTRLTLVHSGFGPEQDTAGLQTGWLNFMSWIKSMLEYGPTWKPPIKKLSPDYYQFYPAAMVQQQDEFLTPA